MHCGFLCAAHIAPDFTRVVCTDAVTIFETTDVYELGFSNLSISIFNAPKRNSEWCLIHVMTQNRLQRFAFSKSLQKLKIFEAYITLTFIFNYILKSETIRIPDSTTY